MIAQCPERWDMGSTNILMIPFDECFGVFISQHDDKLYMASSTDIFEVIRIVGELEVEPMGIFVVEQMKVVFLFTGKIDRLMPIGLAAPSMFTFINFPRSVSIPHRPDAIGHSELLLEALSHAPLHRTIFCFNFEVICCLELQVF